MPRSLPLACFALCVIGLLGRLMPKLYSQMPIFNRWSRRFAWLWKHVFPKVSVDHGCSSFRQNVKFFLTWMIWSRAKYLPSNYGNSMRRFHYVRIGSQKGGTLQAVHALEGLFAPSSGAGEANMAPAPSMVPAPSPPSALACLPPRAARFQIPPMSMLQPGSCLKTEGPMPEEPLEAVPQNGGHSAPQSSVLQSLPVDMVNGALPGFQAHSKKASQPLLAICDSPRVPPDTPAGTEGVKGLPSRSEQVFKRPAAKPKAKVSAKAKPAAKVKSTKKRPAAKKSATADKKSANFDFPKGEISLHQRRLLKPMGCSRCRHSVGCSPSCWAYKGYKALSYWSETPPSRTQQRNEKEIAEQWPAWCTNPSIRHTWLSCHTMFFP